MSDHQRRYSYKHDGREAMMAFIDGHLMSAAMRDSNKDTMIVYNGNDSTYCSGDNGACFPLVTTDRAGSRRHRPTTIANGRQAT